MQQADQVVTPAGAATIVSREHGFDALYACSDATIFTVRAGLPAARLLTDASDILGSCECFLREMLAAAGPELGARLYGVERLVVTARALVDSVEGLPTAARSGVTWVV